MGSSKFTLQPERSLKTDLKKALNASARVLSSEKVKLLWISFSWIGFLLLLKEKNVQKRLEFTSNGLDIVPSFEANPVFYVLSQFAKLFHLGRSFRFLNASP